MRYLQDPLAKRLLIGRVPPRRHIVIGPPAAERRRRVDAWRASRSGGSPPCHDDQDAAMKDLYKILGVAEDADDDAIKKAYRKLAKEYHPDVTGGDKKKTERFKEINEAYGVLGDEQKRKEYDRLKHAPVRADGMPEGFDADAFARAFGGGARTGAGGVEFSGDFDVGGHLLQSVRRRRRRRTRRRAVGGPRAPAAEPWRGHGRAAGGHASPRRRWAPSGRFARAAATRIEIAVPPGVETGGRLRVPGKGAPAPAAGGAAGDLYLESTCRPIHTCAAHGDDIELDLPVTSPRRRSAPRSRSRRSRPGDLRPSRPGRRAAPSCGCAAGASNDRRHARRSDRPRRDRGARRSEPDDARDAVSSFERD